MNPKSRAYQKLKCEQGVMMNGTPRPELTCGQCTQAVARADQLEGGR